MGRLVCIQRRLGAGRGHLGGDSHGDLSFVATCAATLGLAQRREVQGRPRHRRSARRAGAVAGLVAITPACGAVTPIGSIFVGLIAGAICPLAVGLKSRFGYDDSLDVVGVHLVGGVIGTLLIGLFASASMPNKTDGLFYGGGLEQLWKQAIAAGAVMAYSFVVAYIIAFVIKKTMGIRISTEKKKRGSTPSSTGTRRTNSSPPDKLRPARSHSPAPAGPSQQT